MMRYVGLIAGMMLLVVGCGDLEQGSVGPVQIGDDLWNDLTVMQNNIYLTNYDGCEGPGDRIYLYQVDTLGVKLDSVNLGMNGQGYCAVTNDADNFYLVGQTFGNRFRFAQDGELVVWCNSEPRMNGWEQGGIANNPLNDSLYVLMWNTYHTATVRLYTVDQTTLLLGHYYTFEYDGGYDYFAMTYNPELDLFYILCRNEDEVGTIMLMRYDTDTGDLSPVGLLNNDIRGIAYWDGRLIASTDNHHITTIYQSELSSP
jgi:hypothetical protein